MNDNPQKSNRKAAMKRLLIFLMFIPAIANGQNDLSNLNGFKEIPLENILIYGEYLYPISTIIQHQDGKMYDMTEEYDMKFIKTDLKNDKIIVMRHAKEDVYIIKKAFDGKNLLDEGIDERYNCIKYICEADGTAYWEYRYYYNTGVIAWNAQVLPIRLEFVCGEPIIFE